VSISGNGAFTGEVSDEIIKDLGLQWVITGHSERRSLFGETDELVAKKTARALEQGLSVIACIGETLEQRQSGAMWPIIDAQVQALVDHVKNWENTVIAYEPVWAIGTGVVASPQQAQEVHVHLREQLEKKLGVAVAQKLRLLYGGSVNDKNCAELATQPDIDGFLVGGASLQAKAFLTIVAAHAVSDASKK
jgi:triosephosphate isomerase